MSFEIHDHGDYFSLRLSGALGGHELQEAVIEFERLESASAPKHRLTDLTALERIDLGFQEVFELAERRSRRTLGGRVRSAIIARSPLHFGFARMFQMLNTNPQIEIRVLDSEEAALAWFRSGT